MARASPLFNKGLPVLALCFMVLVIALFPNPANAVGPTIAASTASNSCNGGGAGATLSFTCTMAVTSGDIIILFSGWLKGSVGAGTTFTPSDSSGNTYSLIDSKSTQCGNPNSDWCQNWSYSSIASASGTITFTFTFGAAGFIEGNLYDISGGSLTGLTHSNGNANLQPMKVTPFTAQGALTIANYLCDGCNGTNTPGAGYNFISNQPSFSSNGFWGIGENSLTVLGGNEQCQVTTGALIAFAGTCISFSGGGGTGLFNIGSCPTKNTSTFTPVNDTVYFYTGIVPGGGSFSINTLTVAIASVTSATAPESFALYIYMTPSAGGISATNPLNFQRQFVQTLTAGTKNQVITFNANFALGGLQGNTVAIGILANSKILINQSSLGGLMKGSSTLASPTQQFTSLSADSGMLYLCSNGTFNIISTTTVTTTVTPTTTVTQTVTTTSGINNANPSTLGFWFIPLLFMMLGVGVTTGIGEGVSRVQQAPMESGTLAFLVVLGLMIGSWVGTLANVTPLGMSLLLTGMMIIVAWRR